MLMQMVDISEKLMVDNKMRFLECLKSAGKIFPRRQLSLINDEEVISLSHAKVYVFSDSVFSWKCESEPNI